MSLGVVGFLPLGRAEEGEDLFFISGGGMEDMVVGGRRGRRVWTSRLGFLNDQVGFVGENTGAWFPPTLDHVQPCNHNHFGR